MKRLILLISLIITPLFSTNLELTKKELQKLKSNPKGISAIKRFEALKELKKRIYNETTMKKIIDVNLFFNQIMPVDDANKYNADDYWATRREFLINGEGDCEDYVIGKYFTLLELGIPKKDLYFAIVKVDRMADYHMILLYKNDKENELLVMDNLSFRILSLEKRVDITPLAAFNELEARVIKDANLDKKIRINWGKIDKWEEFLSRAYPSKKL